MIALPDACARHASRLATLDPLLHAPALDTAELSAAVPSEDGGSVAYGRLTSTVLDPGEENALWSALRQHALSVRLAGPRRAEALAALLDAWDDVLRSTVAADDTDSLAAIRWPTRDLVGPRELVLHGFAPLTVLAARRAGRTVARPQDVSVRRAETADLSVLADFAVDLLRADTPFGMLTERPTQRDLLAAELAGLLADPDALALVAHDGDDMLGYVTAQSIGGSQWLGELLTTPAARYLPALYVAPGRRRGGVGRALAAAAHREIDASGAEVTLLHYAQPSPTSAPFWPQQGYRPLWTHWLRRPAVRTGASPR